MSVALLNRGGVCPSVSRGGVPSRRGGAVYLCARPASRVPPWWLVLVLVASRGAGVPFATKRAACPRCFVPPVARPCGASRFRRWCPLLPLRRVWRVSVPLRRVWRFVAVVLVYLCRVSRGGGRGARVRCWCPVAARPARLVDYKSKGQKRRARGAVVRFRWLSKSARRGGLCVPWWN